MKIAVLFALCLFAVAGHAMDFKTCAKLLSSPYEYASTFSARGQSLWSLRPETGSIEHRNPGVVKHLLQTRVMLNQKKKMFLPPPDALPNLTRLVVQDLNKASLSFPDGQFSKLVADFLEANRGDFAEFSVEKPIPVTEFNRKVSKLNSSLWELTLATLIQADEIHINVNLPRLFPELHSINREIDIIVKTNGRWRWFEIKDWSREKAEEEVAYEKLFKQSSAQDQIRKQLGIPVELVLMMKYSVSEGALERLKSTLPYDGILFVLPTLESVE